MMQKHPLKYWFTDKRATTYLLWAFLTIFGFTLTHLNQQRRINGLWFGIVVIGLGYMVYVMPLKERRMKAILASWAVPLTIGMFVSALSFSSRSISNLTEYLGVYWFGVMALGYFLNGLADAPARWYMIAAAVNSLAAVTVLASHSLLHVQYLLAAVVSGWSMFMLWLFRSEAQ